MTREELLKVAKPILFNTEMVRAILEGRKTVTRRCVKAKSKNACGFFVTTRKSDGAFMGVYDYDENERMFESPQTQPAYVGDILYVRETWTDWGCYKCEVYECYCNCGIRKYLYRADGEIDEEKWRPSIHMPKDAARIFLKVKDVRVERLQEIKPEHIRKEGIHLSVLPSECKDQYNKLGAVYELEGAKISFIELWNSTIKKSDLDTYGWDANPWVWVIEFERIEVIG